MNDMDKSSFADRLSRFRWRKGISARDMSLSIGQNPGYINNIESGKALPSMASFFYICEYLGITPAEFFMVDQDCPERIREIDENLHQLNEHDLKAVLYLTDRMLGKPNNGL